jgi:glutaredoxin
MRCLLPIALLLCLGCDAATDLADRVLETAADGSAATSAQRPEGWESLEDEASAMRLYYQFVDAQRRVRFVERLEDVPEAQRASVGFVKMEAPPPLTPGDAARARQTRLASNGSPTTSPAAPAGAEIVLYSAEWCGACRKAKRHLDRNGVAYQLRDIDQPGHAEELVRRTGARAIPVLEVEGRMITGFSTREYDALLREV